jgi:hypothetical protein
MADAEPEDETPGRGISDQRRPLRTDIGMPQIDVGHPCAHLDTLCSYAHELGGRQGIVVDFRGEDGVEPCVLSLTGHHLDLCGAPPRPRNDRQSQSVCRHFLLYPFLFI